MLTLPGKGVPELEAPANFAEKLLHLIESSLAPTINDIWRKEALPRKVQHSGRFLMEKVIIQVPRLLAVKVFIGEKQHHKLGTETTFWNLRLKTFIAPEIPENLYLQISRIDPGNSCTWSLQCSSKLWLLSICLCSKNASIFLPISLPISEREKIAVIGGSMTGLSEDYAFWVEQNLSIFHLCLMLHLHLLLSTKCFVPNLCWRSSS